MSISYRNITLRLKPSDQETLDIIRQNDVQLIDIFRMGLKATMDELRTLQRQQIMSENKKGRK